MRQTVLAWALEAVCPGDLSADASGSDAQSGKCHDRACKGHIRIIYDRADGYYGESEKTDHQ